MTARKQESTGSADEAKRGAEARDWSWVEATVWTERMVSALGNGVKGGRWYSLMDKVYAPAHGSGLRPARGQAKLMAAWTKVRANKGAAGVDGQSLERFAARSERYLAELASALREDSYRPQPVKRVDIPKGDGRTRPLGIPVVKDRIVQTALNPGFNPGRSSRRRSIRAVTASGRGGAVATRSERSTA